MSGISTAIELTDRMSYPLHSITSALDSTLGVFEDFKSSLGSSFDDSKIHAARVAIDEANASIDSMNNKMNQGKVASTSFLKSLMGFSIIQKTFNMITGQIDSAISRFDALNNFPKVMSNLGISADQSNAAMKVLSKGLQGLPTTLNDAVGAVQRFTSANKNIGASTKMFLALNNAILAGGAEASTQQTALEQLSQAYAKGKPDMMEWRSAMTAMPAQLSQVATAMGFVSADALGESLREGKTSMNEFMQTLIKLNEEGINGLPSLAEQAKNATGGIATSIQNMKTSVTRGVTSLIESINSGLTKAGFGTIQDIITKLGSGMENMLTGVGNAAANIITFLAPAVQLIQQVATFIGENWSIIEPIIMGIVTAMGLYYGALLAYNTIQGISTGITAMSTFAKTVHAAALKMETGATFSATVAQYGFNAALLACPITWILIAIIAIIAAIYLVIAAINKITGSSISATGVIVGALTTAVAFVWNLFLGLLDLVLGVINAMVNPWISFANFFANIFNDPIGAIVHLFGDFADSILGVIESIAKALDKVFGSNLAGAVQGWRSGLSSMVESVANQYGNGSYEKVAEELNLSSESLGLKRWEYGDAWNTGYSWGQGIEESIGNLGSSIGDTVNDTMNSLGMDTLSNDTATTAGNTGKINDTLKTSEEDLQYLRDIAEQETINRFTTAEIKVDMGGVNNTVNNNTDLDGVVNYLANGVQEAMEKAAEGVYE